MRIHVNSAQDGTWSCQESPAKSRAKSSKSFTSLWYDLLVSRNAMMAKRKHIPKRDWRSLICREMVTSIADLFCPEAKVCPTIRVDFRVLSCVCPGILRSANVPHNCAPDLWCLLCKGRRAWIWAWSIHEVLSTGDVSLLLRCSRDRTWSVHFKQRSWQVWFPAQASEISHKKAELVRIYDYLPLC